MTRAVASLADSDIGNHRVLAQSTIFLNDAQLYVEICSKRTKPTNFCGAWNEKKDRDEEFAISCEFFLTKQCNGLKFVS